MAKKILAILLASVMVFCAVPFCASAEEASVSSADRTAGWNANFGLVIDKLLNNEESAHWKYVAENNKAIADTMLTYTVFALYDNAWKNGFDQSVSVDTAEDVLVSLIEKIDANIGDSKISEIIKVLETATSLNDLLQKVNSYVQISDVLTSTEWSTAFQYIEWAIKVGKLYEKERDKVIQAYAQILSVQAANEYYKDFLQYIVDNCSYSVVVTAASNLITEIDESVESLIKSEVLKAGGFAASELFDTAARIAMETNAYTAVALKVYNIGTSVADKLWNTSDQYVLMDELYTTFFVETAASEWAGLAKTSGDASLYEFAISAMVTLREVGYTTLFDLKLAQNEGLIGKIKNQINYNISFEYITEMAFIELVRYILFDIPVADYAPVITIASVNSNAVVTYGDDRMSTVEKIVTGENGYYSVFYNDYTKSYVKTLFLTVDGIVTISSDAANSATMIIEKNFGSGVVEESFTNATVDSATTITVDTSLANSEYFVNGEAVALNETFEYPPYNAVTASSVASAVVSVAKQEVAGNAIDFGDFIKMIFEKIAAFFSLAFAKLKK